MVAKAEQTVYLAQELTELPVVVLVLTAQVNIVDPESPERASLVKEITAVTQPTTATAQVAVAVVPEVPD